MGIIAEGGSASSHRGAAADRDNAGHRRPAQIGYRKNRLILAFTVAAISDALAVFVAFAPPLQWALDVGTAALLFLILGSQWMILPGLIAEAIPGDRHLPFLDTGRRLDCGVGQDFQAAELNGANFVRM